jgi:hypothetical protein
MNPLPEQLSSAGKTQLLAQLDFFGTLACAAPAPSAVPAPPARGAASAAPRTMVNN